MGPPENRTKPAEKQEARRRQLARRPRIRRCLLKGCEQRFHPRQVGQRYCSQACREAARVITKEVFSRSFLRPAGLLRGIRAGAAKSLAALLLAGVPARAGARPRTGAALETGARFSPEILIRRWCWPYLQAVRCNWSFTNSIGAGSTFECAIRRGSGGCWRSWPRAASKRPSWWWPPKATRTVMWSSTATSGSRPCSNWAGTRWKQWYGR